MEILYLNFQTLLLVMTILIIKYLSQNKSIYVIKFNGARNIVKLKAVKHRQCRFNYLALNCAAACRLTSNSQLAVQPALTQRAAKWNVLMRKIGMSAFYGIQTQWVFSSLFKTSPAQPSGSAVGWQGRRAGGGDLRSSQPQPI